MRLRGKLLQDVQPTDVLALVSDEVPESVELDYKQELPGDPGGERKDFARDVAAMANTRGGVLLYGIAERVEEGKKTGVPDKIVGVSVVAPDDALRRLEQIVRDQTDPPLTRCLARAVVLPTKELVIGVGVPRSLLGPHAVNGAYYRRGATSNYRVGTQELRQMFLEHDAWGQEVQKFRDERIDKVRAGSTIRNLDRQGSLFLHILPLGRLHAIVDIVARRNDLRSLAQNSPLVWGQRPNLDGYLLYSEEGGVCKMYMQWLRCGGMEFYSSLYHHVRGAGTVLDLDATHMASDAVKHARTALEFMNKQLGLGPPYAVVMSLLDVDGGSILIRGWERLMPFSARAVVNRFDSDLRGLPAVVVEDAEADVKAAMLPLFDMIWQAAGYDDCFMRRAKDEW